MRHAHKHQTNEQHPARRRVTAGLVAAAFWPGAFAQEVRGADEPALRRQLDGATWPAEIVRLADDYLQRFPAGPAAAEAASLRERAARAAQAIARSEVRLYRAAFEPPQAAPAVMNELRRAALGDHGAAWRLARAQPRDMAGSDELRYIGWLQFAASLGSDGASYELALHYRKRGQPALAARYEARALELGFVPPRALDHVRK
jgi:hypothetical protein